MQYLKIKKSPNLTVGTFEKNYTNGEYIVKAHKISPQVEFYSFASKDEILFASTDKLSSFFTLAISRVYSFSHPTM